MIDEKKLSEDIKSRHYISDGLREIFETIIDEQPQANKCDKCPADYCVVPFGQECPLK